MDRERWARYLNDDVIDKWIEAGKPADEAERDEQVYIALNLEQCALFDNLVKKVRG